MLLDAFLKNDSPCLNIWSEQHNILFPGWILVIYIITDVSWTFQITV